jgi:ribosome silencing factor RsfS/YbeB/iojap
MAVKRAKTTKRPNSVSKAPSKKAAGKKAASKTKTAASTKAKAKTATKKATKKAAVAAPASSKAGSGVVTVVEKALDDMKAVNVKVLDVAQLTDITDTMVIATGNSDRHVRSIADRVVEFAKKAGFRPMGVEGERDGEWVLVDLQDVIVHIMLPRVREFYRLENLWDVSAARREAVAASG